MAKSATLTIAGKDIKQRIRDRSALILGVVAPLALALIFNAILGDLDTGSFDLRYGIVNEDGGEVADQFLEIMSSLEADGIVELESDMTTADAEQRVEDGELSSVFIIPAGFSDATAMGTAASMTIIGNVDAPTSTAIARSIAEGFVGGVHSVQLSVAATIAADPNQAANIDEIVRLAATAPQPIEVGAIEAATRELDLATFFIVGMAVFFVFFTVAFGVTSLLDERTNGTLPRLLAAPINRNAILGGKAIVSVALGLISMTVLIVASTLVMGATWGNPIGVAILTVAVVISAVGIMAIVAAFSTTAEQAGNLQAIIAVGLGMLGGIFFPAALGDGIIAALSYISPHRWYVLGLSDLAGGTLSDIIPSTLALLAFGLIPTAIALPRLRRMLVT